MECAGYSEYIYFSKVLNYNFLIFIHFYIIWNVFLVPVTSKWTEINKITYREEHQWLIMWQRHCLRHSKSWNKDINDQSSPRFFFSLHIYIYIYYNHTQVDFDFGQVCIVWWLSYSQVGEKISVEPWVGWLLLAWGPFACLSMLPRIFLEAILKVNGALGNIRGNLTALHLVPGQL